ncbi:response regulator transcription factor [Allohahella marinimesophila]|uniref:Winged helix-turn-helix domain-containing protein n=1 Tax=Allohahella marinimesophila TaxID=1054972 RepID=A0ABP7NHV2_9GAMM
MRLLLLEDELDTANYVIRGFEQHDDVVVHAGDGHTGLLMAMEGGYDALMIDRMLPGLDGLKVLSMLRAGGDRTPAIFLTAVGGLKDRIEGLDLADDYLVKPFAFAELQARIGAICRRPQGQVQDTMLKVADLEIDLLRRTVQRAGQAVALQPTELRLLECLLRQKGRVVTRTMLLEDVWEFHFDPGTNIVETHISRLRAKIDRGYDRELIRTVRGSGYMIDDSD